MGLLDRLRENKKRKQLDKAHEALAEGKYLCLECENETSLQDFTPLKHSNCPHCKDLFLAPCYIDGWWITQPLGGGGMGAVYQAFHSKDREYTAAVKVLQEHSSENQIFVDLLLKEAKIGQTFGKHDNLSQIYSYGRSETGFAYVIMQMIEGERLDHIIEGGQGQKGVGEELALYLMYDILQALKRVYEAGYLYRDLKPENIIIQDDGRGVLVDYGLCVERYAAWHIITDEVMGSPLYMPPERIEGQGEDVRGEIYSFGLVLYHVASGQPYFTQKEIMKVVERQTQSLRVQASHKLKKFSSEFGDFMNRLTAFSRSDRYQSYEDLEQDLLDILVMQSKKMAKDDRVTEKRKLFSL